MACSFSASVVSYEPFGGVWTVGFYETPSEEGRYLILQKKEHESEQDRKLGLVGEYVELNDQLFGAYGAVESVYLHRSKIEVLVAPDARAKLGEAEIDVAFNLSDADVQSLRSVLVQILGVSRVHVA
jgi:hypothetical protein